MTVRAWILSALCLAVVACGGGPTEPSPAPALSFSVAPNPVPYTGVLSGCAFSPVAAKTWVYTLRISNTGNAPFTVASFSARVTSPLIAGPVDSPYDAALFAQAFGSTTIPAGGQVSSQLCVAGPYDSATLTWTFVGASGGGSFSTPLIQFLPSGVPN